MQNIKDVMKNIVIVDYHLGNLFSVKQACDTIGINARVSSSKVDIEDADALILPGVGAFIEAMQNLEQLGLIDPLKKSVQQGKPLFGVCLGLQLLFTRSEEFGSGLGLDLISGTIKKFPPTSAQGSKVKVPQIAWNTIYRDTQNWQNSPLFDVPENEFMYFVHSYFVEPKDSSCVLTKTNYEGLEYCSSVLQDNIFATQFHPEKSAEKGLAIYKNWASNNNLI